MKEFIYQEKIRIIKESTQKQLIEIEELKKSGEIDKQEAANFQQIIIDVFKMQQENYDICA